MFCHRLLVLGEPLLVLLEPQLLAGQPFRMIFQTSRIALLYVGQYHHGLLKLPDARSHVHPRHYIRTPEATPFPAGTSIHWTRFTLTFTSMAHRVTLAPVII